MVSARSGRPRIKFSARAVSTRRRPPPWAASAAAATPFGGHTGVVDRVALARVVLDRTPGQPDLDGEGDGAGHLIGRVGVTVLQVGRHWHVDGCGEGGGVGERLVARHGAVRTSERAGE